MSRLTPEDVAAWLVASCAEQGVPVLVTDPRVLATVAALLAGPVAAPDRAERGRGGP